MGPTKAEVLQILESGARSREPSGPVELSRAYLRAVERWEDLRENAEGTDKTWVARCRRDFDLHFARARTRA